MSRKRRPLSDWGSVQRNKVIAKVSHCSEDAQARGTDETTTNGTEAAPISPPSALMTNADMQAEGANETTKAIMQSVEVGAQTCLACKGGVRVMEKKMELLQSWFQEGCSFRVQFEKAADIFWEQPVGGNSIPRNWKTFKEMNVHLIALYNCPGEAPFPRQAPQFIDLLSIWGYCAEIPDHHHRLAFIWFKQLSQSYAKCVEWDAPQFKSADAIYGPLPGNSQHSGDSKTNPEDPGSNEIFPFFHSFFRPDLFTCRPDAFTRRPDPFT